MEVCPRCGGVLREGFCDTCGYPVGFQKLILIKKKRKGAYKTVGLKS